MIPIKHVVLDCEAMRKQTLKYSSFAWLKTFFHVFCFVCHCMTLFLIVSLQSNFLFQCLRFLVDIKWLLYHHIQKWQPKLDNNLRNIVHYYLTDFQNTASTKFKYKIKDTLFSVIDVKMSDFVIIINVAIFMLIVFVKVPT